MGEEQAPDGPGALAALVESVTALAEHTRLHGPLPDCGARMDALIAKHRTRIEAARWQAAEATARSDAAE